VESYFREVDWEADEMSVNRDYILNAISGSNGEIRIQGVRYGEGWYCLLILQEQFPAVDDTWYDLICGDNDYFEAEKTFKYAENVNGDVFLRRGDTIEAAIDAAFEAAAERIDKH
jgi:hypothetical protein